ncbi:hypothetical protein C8J56DRAFT_940600 [Mycena floridula]|nr:hypothetical protein C8J56DRAFT_940600 [Mycena floridula]
MSAPSKQAQYSARHKAKRLAEDPIAFRARNALAQRKSRAKRKAAAVDSSQPGPSTKDKASTEANPSTEPAPSTDAGTSTSSASPFRSPSPLTEISPSPPPSPSKPPLNLDYLSDTIGVQCHASAPIQCWNTEGHSFTTALPFLPTAESTAERPQNALQADAQAVRRMAEYNVSEHPNVVKVHYDTSNLISQIHSLSAQGKFIVIEGYPDPLNMAYTVRDLQDQLQLSPHVPLSSHDMATRAKDPLNPYVRTTLQHMVQDANNPNIVRAVLDSNVSHITLPKKLQGLDEGAIAWNLVHTEYPPTTDIPVDVYQLRHWILIHHGTVYTYPHHDANGLATVILPEVGDKLWAPMWPKWGPPPCQPTQKSPTQQTRAEYIEVMHRFISEETEPSPRKKTKKNQPTLTKYDHFADIFVHVARKGEIIIQPPNLFHMVYTPQKAITIGGHFLTYGAMHLTEISRWFDSKYPATTNHNHIGVESTLVRMMLALPIHLCDSKSFHRRPLIALCRMILFPEQYRDSEIPGVKHPPVILNDAAHKAQDIAIIVLKQLGFTQRGKSLDKATLEALHVGVFGAAYDNPGPLVSLEPTLFPSYDI